MPLLTAAPAPPAPHHTAGWQPDCQSEGPYRHMVQARQKGVVRACMCAGKKLLGDLLLCLVVRSSTDLPKSAPHHPPTPPTRPASLSLRLRWMWLERWCTCTAARLCTVSAGHLRSQLWASLCCALPCCAAASCAACRLVVDGSWRWLRRSRGGVSELCVLCSDKTHPAILPCSGH